MKKFFSMLLVIALMFTCCHVSASAAKTDSEKSISMFTDERLTISTNVCTGITLTSSDPAVVVKKTTQNGKVVVKGTALNKLSKIQYDAVSDGESQIYCYNDNKLALIVNVNIEALKIIGCGMEESYEAIFLCYSNSGEKIESGIYWKSTNTSVATVTKYGGKVLTLKEGKCNIQVLSTATNKVLATYKLVVS